MTERARPSNRCFAVSLALILALVAAFSLVAAQAAHALPCRDCGPNGDDTSGGGTGTGTANTPPMASFTVSPSSPTAGQLVTFSSTSTDEENNISRYEWDLDGDGLFETKTTDPSATK